MAAMWCKYKKARRVIMVDKIPERLALAEKIGCETINYQEHTDIVGKFQEIIPNGPIES
jgi:threonine dehydrogenase-like Zn-dependent dehydrogenase